MIVVMADAKQLMQWPWSYSTWLVLLFVAETTKVWILVTAEINMSLSSAKQALLQKKCCDIFIWSFLKIIVHSNTDDLLSWLMQNSWCNGRDCIVVSNSRCGRDNPSSNPGHGRDKHESLLVRQISYFCKNKCWYIFIRSCLKIIEQSNTDDLLSWLMYNSWCNGRDRIVVSTSRCGRDNPGSNPGRGRDKHESLVRQISCFCKNNVVIYLYRVVLK